MRTVRQLLDDYFSWEVVVNDGKAILDAKELENRFKIPFWNALIVQAALDAEAAVVYSEDLNHKQNYSGVTVFNPFIH